MFKKLLATLLLTTASVLAQTVHTYGPLDGNNIWSGPQQFKTFNTISNAALTCTNPASLDQSCIANAVAANKTIQVPAGTYLFSSTVTISQSNVTIQCLPNAILKASGTTLPLITFTGVNAVMTGCTVDSSGIDNYSSALASIELNGATNPVLKGNTFINGQNQNVRADNLVGSGGELAFNTVTWNGTGDMGGFIFYGNADGLNVHDNVVYGSINTHINGAGQHQHGFSISNNKIYRTPTAHYPGFCIEIQDNFAVASGISGFAVQGNQCTITGTGSGTPAYGGISLGVTLPSTSTANTNCNISNNVVNAAGEYLNIAGIEAVTVGCTIANNTLYELDPGATDVGGIILHYSNNVVTGNTIIGWGNSTNTAGITVTPQGVADNNVITQNLLINPTASSSAFYASGIKLDCNHNGLSINNTTVDGNSVTTTASAGIQALGNDGVATCSVTGTLKGNTVVNAVTGVLNEHSSFTYGTNRMVGVGTTYNVTAGAVAEPVQQISPQRMPSATIDGDVNGGGAGYFANGVYNGDPTAPFPTGLVARYRASDVCPVNGATLSNWAPSGGLGNTLSGGATPGTCETNVINGQATVRFVGTETGYAGAFPATAINPSIVFVVYKKTIGSANVWLYDDTQFNSFNAMSFAPATTLKGSGSGTPIAGTIPDDGNFHVAAFSIDGSGNGVLYLDGTQVATGVPGGANMTGITIGAIASGTNALHGDIAEVLVYSNQLLTFPQIGAVGQYLQTQYGITQSGAWNVNAQGGSMSAVRTNSIQLGQNQALTSESSNNPQLVTCPTGGNGSQYCGADGIWHTIVTPTVTVCSGTISLSTSSIAVAAKVQNTATCTGAQVGDNVAVDWQNNDPDGIAGYDITAGEVITLSKKVSAANTIDVEQASSANNSAPIIPGTAVLTFRVFR